MSIYTTKSLNSDKKDRNSITEVVQVVVHEMREISKHIPSKAFKMAAKKIIDRYPNIFKDVDSDGVVVGDGSHSLFSKLTDRNNYLNRPHKRTSNEKFLQPAIPKNKIKMILNARAGCSNWQPDIPDTVQVAETDQEKLKTMDVTNDEIIILLENTFALQRQFLNNINEVPTITDIRNSWPILLTKRGILWHFQKLTGTSLQEISNKMEERSDKILEFGKLKKLLVENEEEMDGTNFKLSLEVVAKYFKERMEAIFVEVGVLYKFSDFIFCIYRS